MPGFRPKYMSDPERCLETRETIRNMISYVTSDEKIARHCGVRTEFVARVRKGRDPHEDACRKHRKTTTISNTLGITDDGAAEFRKWCGETERASRMLAEGILQAGVT